jgi:hypothetical protein
MIEYINNNIDKSLVAIAEFFGDSTVAQCNLEINLSLMKL